MTNTTRADPHSPATGSRRLLAAALALLTAVVTSGLSAGFFFTYTVSVTRGLRLVDDATYVATMQSINETVRTGWFAVVFFGPLPLLAAAAILLARPGAARRALVTAGAAVLYAAGVLGVTFLGIVPLNDDLAEATSTSPAALQQARSDYEDSWNDLTCAKQTQRCRRPADSDQDGFAGRLPPPLRPAARQPNPHRRRTAHETTPARSPVRRAGVVSLSITSPAVPTPLPSGAAETRKGRPPAVLRGHQPGAALSSYRPWGCEVLLRRKMSPITHSLGHPAEGTPVPIHRQHLRGGELRLILPDHARSGVQRRASSDPKHSPRGAFHTFGVCKAGNRTRRHRRR
jgi:uncharacterized membrane protein